MTLAAALTDTQTALTKTGSALAKFNIAYTGFQPTTYTPRSAAPVCVQDDWAYIGPGWNYGGPSYFITDLVRTKDFVTFYSPVTPHGMESAFLSGMASDGVRIHKGFGCNTYPAITNDDLVTDKVYAMVPGEAAQLETHAMPPRECADMWEGGDYIYTGLGIRYTGSTNPTYVMPRDIWRKPKSGGAWALCNSDIGYRRRDYAAVYTGDRHLIIGGASDLQDTSPVDRRVVHASLLVTEDDFTTVTTAGNGPFGPLFGHSGAIAWDHVVIANGAYGDGTFSDQVTFSNKVWAAPIELAHIPAEWFEIASLPIACDHGMMIFLDGKLRYLPGYNNVTHPSGPPSGIYTLSSLNGSWA
jgi:hypothetical protein